MRNAQEILARGFACLLSVVLACSAPAIATAHENGIIPAASPQTGKCPNSGGDRQTVFIIPRVYIEYTGRSSCWSEVLQVELTIDFFRLQEIAQEEGDVSSRKVMNHASLVDFFTWLLESGRYAMPGGALLDVLNYEQRQDYRGLYLLFRDFARARAGR